MDLDLQCYHINMVTDTEELKSMISGLLQYEFLQNAFFTGIIIGIIAPLIGVFVVVRRLSLLQMPLVM